MHDALPKTVADALAEAPAPEPKGAHSLSRLWQQPLARKPFSGIGRDGDLFVLYSGGKEVCRGSMDYCRRRQRALLEDDE